MLSAEISTNHASVKSKKSQHICTPLFILTLSREAGVADKMANSADPDQMAALVNTQFSLACLSKYVG